MGSTSGQRLFLCACLLILVVCKQIFQFCLEVSKGVINLSWVSIEDRLFSVYSDASRTYSRPHDPHVLTTFSPSTWDMRPDLVLPSYQNSRLILAWDSGIITFELVDRNNSVVNEKQLHSWLEVSSPPFFMAPQKLLPFFWIKTIKVISMDWELSLQYHTVSLSRISPKLHLSNSETSGHKIICFVSDNPCLVQTLASTGLKSNHILYYAPALSKRHALERNSLESLLSTFVPPSSFSKLTSFSVIFAT